MNLLEEFESEVDDNKKVICLTPYDRDFPFKYLSITEYIECENLSNLWKPHKDFGNRPEEFEYSYVGEDGLMVEINEDSFKKVLYALHEDEGLDYGELTLDLLRWHFGYEDHDISFYEYNFDIRDSQNNYVCYYNEEDLAKEILKEQYEIDVDELASKHDCIAVSVNADCFFGGSNGEWEDLPYKDYKRLKIEFIQN